MRRSTDRSVVPAAITMIVLVSVVWVADRSIGMNEIRLAVFDSISPARKLLAGTADDAGLISAGSGEQSGQATGLENQLLQNELQRRQLLIENARLRRLVTELERQKPLRRVVGANLVDFVAVETTVLNPSELPRSLQRAVLDAGRDRELIKSQLVVSGSGPVIDKGIDHGLSPGNKVVNGAIVLGRLKSVARWVSQVEPVTSPNFTAAVQLIRRTPHGATFGAKGLLVGADSICEVNGVASTESVSVGDEVYTASLEGIQGPRLFFGKVSRVDFAAGGQWKIQVTPAATVDQYLNDIAVVRPRLSSERVAEHSTTQMATN